MMRNTHFKLVKFTILSLILFISPLGASSILVNKEAIPIRDTKVMPEMFDRTEIQEIEFLLGPIGKSAEGIVSKKNAALLSTKEILFQENEKADSCLVKRFGKALSSDYNDRLMALLNEMAPGQANLDELILKYRLPGNWGGLRAGEAKSYHIKEKKRGSSIINTFYEPVTSGESKFIQEVRQRRNSSFPKPIDILKFEKSLESGLENFVKFFRADVDLFNFSVDSEYQKSYELFRGAMECIRRTLQTFWLGEQMLVRCCANYYRENDLLKQDEKKARYLNFAQRWYDNSIEPIGDMLASQAIEVGILNAIVMLKQLTLRGWTTEALSTGIKYSQKNQFTIRFDSLLKVYIEEKFTRGISQIISSTRENALVEGNADHFYKILTEQYYSTISAISASLDEEISKKEKTDFPFSLTTIKINSIKPNLYSQLVNPVEEAFFFHNDEILFDQFFINNKEQELTARSSNNGIFILNSYKEKSLPFVQHLMENLKTSNLQEPFATLYDLNMKTYFNFRRSSELWIIMNHTYFNNEKEIIDEVVKQSNNEIFIDEQVYQIFAKKNDAQLKLKEFILKARSKVGECAKINNRAASLLSSANAYYG